MERIKFPERGCTISAIVDLIDQGKILLKPPYQRGKVWTDKDMREHQL